MLDAWEVYDVYLPPNLLIIIELPSRIPFPIGDRIKNMPDSY